MSGSNTYYKELQDDNTTETAKLMHQSNGCVNGCAVGDNDGQVIIDVSNGNCVSAVNGTNGDCGNGVVLNGDGTLDEKPISNEMSTSTSSLKCCTGLWLNNKRKFKIVKETQTNGNGNCVEKPVPVQPITANGVDSRANFYNTLREKLQNGRACGNGKVKCEKVPKKPKVLSEPVYVDRDPYHVNTNIRYEFMNVFAEPNNGTYSWNPIWSFTNAMYFNMKLYLYRIFAILIGIPSAFLWAILFSLFSVVQIWILQPFIRLFKAIFAVLRDIWSTIVDCVFGPTFQLFQYTRLPQQQVNMV